MKSLFNTVLLIIPFVVFSQAKMYITADVEAGSLTTTYDNLDTTISDPIIDSEESHYNIKGSVGFVMEWNKFLATTGLSQSMRFWNLRGEKNGNMLKVTNRQNFPSVFIGGFYQIPLTIGKVDLNLIMGSKVGVDFIDYNSLNEKSGVETDYIVSNTKESNKILLNIIPEIGVKGYFSSGNYWQLSGRYNIPVDGDVIEGTIEHHLNNNLNEIIEYNATGQFVGIALTYGFNLIK